MELIISSGVLTFFVLVGALVDSLITASALPTAHYEDAFSCARPPARTEDPVSELVPEYPRAAA